MASLIVPPLDEVPFPTLGPQVVDFIEERAIFGPGDLMGEPAVVSSEKRAIIYRAYEVYPQGHRYAGRRRFKRVGWSVRKGMAKALALDTRLPSPSGWVRMGDVRVGDVLFDERGKPCRVTAVSPVYLGNDCYRIRFRDGAEIVADAGHRWLTEELRRQVNPETGRMESYVGSVKTTVDLAATVTLRADGALNHRIPVAGALELPETDLLVDPWVLGAWLGDGRTDDSEFTMHPGDYEHFVERVESAGYFHQVPKVDSRNGVYAVRVSTSPIVRGGSRRDTLKGRLRELGLIGNKMVPAEYLRGSMAQRLALLQGLMDTDGTIDPKGATAAFTSTVRALADGVHELACSLGLKPSIRQFVTASGSDAWKVCFFADDATPVFSLPRKAERQRPRVSRTPMSSNRHIVSVEKVASVPTRCIAVDSDSHLFLAGESMIPTHNTELESWIAYAELHPEGPVRCDGFDADGEPVGRPVNSPYIPMLAYSKDQVEELAFGVLTAVCTEGPDADLFDVSLERILRLSARGRDDGKAVPLANSPNARDGARTTFQAFDEPHRMYLPRIREAHETMNNNLPKRPAADAWSLYVGTAGQLGQNSIAEDLYHEAQAIARGEVDEPRFFFFHRDAGQVHRGEKDRSGHDLSTAVGRITAISEATGPEGEWGPGQFEDIAELYTRPKTDKAYWERVQLNLWVQGDAQAFDPQLLVTTPGTIPLGSLVTAGFDGARFRDSTAIVITDVLTGKQQLYAIWERPLDVEDWEVPVAEVDAVVDQLFYEYDVWRWNGDPPHWLESHANWAGKYPQVEEWFTHRTRAMAFALRDYGDSLKDGSVSFADDTALALNSPIAGETMGDALIRHIGNAGKHLVNIWDTGDENEEVVEGADQARGRQLFILRKIHQDRKFDACMAAVLSWQGRIAALQNLDLTQSTDTAVRRLY